MTARCLYVSLSSSNGRGDRTFFGEQRHGENKNPVQS